jgi:hypothetical protein
MRSDIAAASSNPHRAADVVDDEMEAVQSERVDRSGAKPPQPGPRIVEVGRARRRAEAGKVEGHAAQTPCGQFREDLSVQEARRRHAVKAHDGSSLAFLSDEAGHACSLEVAADRPVPPHNLRPGHARELIRRSIERKASDSGASSWV